MKSPLYFLTVLLPVTLAMPSSESEVNDQSLEERWQGQQQKCKVNHDYYYYKWPCYNYKYGSYKSGEVAQYQCK